MLALGLATFVPVMLSRSDVYEVPIACGYMLTMLALVAIWCALHEAQAEYPLAGCCQRDVRARGRSAAFLAVWFGNLARAGRPGVARTSADCAFAGDSSRSYHTHRAGLAALQHSAFRSSAGIRAALPVVRRPTGSGATIQPALSLVQFPYLLSGAGALEHSCPLRAGHRRAPLVRRLWEGRESIRYPNQHSTRVAGSRRAVGLAQTAAGSSFHLALLCNSHSPAFWRLRDNRRIFLFCLPPLRSGLSARAGATRCRRHPGRRARAGQPAVLASDGTLRLELVVNFLGGV